MSAISFVVDTGVYNTHTKYSQINHIMIKQVWKFEITPKQTTLEMPKGAEILTIQLQNEKPCIWALVNPENAKELRHFEVYGTGANINCDIGIERIYRGTFQINNLNMPLVFHLFERLN